MRLTTLAVRFLRIGSTGFGGPMALIGLIQQHFVDRGKEVSADDFAEGVAVGQMLPGPVAVDCATHISYRLRGLVGAIVGTGSLILPSFLLMLVVTPLYLSYGQVPQVAGFFKGVGPAVVAVIVVSAWRLGGKFVTNYAAATVAIVAMLATMLGVSPAVSILVAGVLGILLAPRSEGGEKG